MFYNGQRIKVKSFQEYVEMYLGTKDTGVPRVYERFSDRWEVCIATTDGQFNQVGGGVGAWVGGGAGPAAGQWLVCAWCWQGTVGGQLAPRAVGSRVGGLLVR